MIEFPVTFSAEKPQNLSSALKLNPKIIVAVILRQTEVNHRPSFEMTLLPLNCLSFLSLIRLLQHPREDSESYRAGTTGNCNS